MTQALWLRGSRAHSSSSSSSNRIVLYFRKEQNEIGDALLRSDHDESTTYSIILSGLEPIFYSCAIQGEKGHWIESQPISSAVASTRLGRLRSMVGVEGDWWAARVIIN
jgi:hypothetical protein